MTLGNSMLIPILPAIRKELGISSFQVSMIITVYSIVAIFLIPIAGFLSDRYGRKKVIIPSLAVAGAGGLLSGIAALWLEHAYVWILLGRLLQGVGAAGAAPIVMPLVGDMFKKESDVSEGLGAIETANTFGKVLSPILGSLLAAVVWYVPFFAIPVFCLVSLVMVGFLVKVPKKREQEPPSLGRFLKSIKQVFGEKGRWLYAIFAIGGIFMFVLFAALFYLSQILEDLYNIDGVFKGALLAIPTAALCLSSFTAGKWIGENKRRMKWVNFFGASLATAAMLVCGWFRSDSIYMLFIFMTLGGIGIGMALPCLDAMITEGIVKEQRGTVSSIYSSMRFIGVAADPPVASLLMEQTHRMLFFTMAGVGVLAALLAMFAIKPKQYGGKPKPPRKRAVSEESGKEYIFRLTRKGGAG
ncbi:MFS transporter [Paenibacillus hamazuiensis]|uniref:MFS transporter n=1 Tax=Paenibacillus hamazuiensis TaxID=2936508 RepID=UPI0020109F69|nr:MFS transporter [Paenibacillus hamazuiensis]